MLLLLDLRKYKGPAEEEEADASLRFALEDAAFSEFSAFLRLC